MQKEGLLPGARGVAQSSLPARKKTNTDAINHESCCTLTPFLARSLSSFAHTPLVSWIDAALDFATLASLRMAWR